MRRQLVASRQLQGSSQGVVAGGRSTSISRPSSISRNASLRASVTKAFASALAMTFAASNLQIAGTRALSSFIASSTLPA